MAIQKKPLYVFETNNDYGIDQVPEHRLVLVESTKQFYILKDVTGLSHLNTVQDAINAGKMIKLWSAISDGPKSNLTATWATYWNGYRIISMSQNEPDPNIGQENDIWFQYHDEVLPDLPNAPTNFTASDDRQDGIFLNWTNPISNFDGINIYRDGVLYKIINNSNTNSMLDEDTEVGQVYIYYVESFNARGSSSPSNQDTGERCASVTLTAVIDYDQVAGNGSYAITKNSDGNFTFNTPPSTYEIEITLLGAGGSGATFTHTDGILAGGGYAGEIIKETITIAPGDNIPIVIGKGGEKVLSNNYDPGTNGNPGGNTIFGNVIAAGGSGGICGDETDGYLGMGAQKNTLLGIGYDGERACGTKCVYGGESSGLTNGGNANHRKGDAEDGGIGSGGGAIEIRKLPPLIPSESGYSGAGGNGRVTLVWTESSCGGSNLPGEITDFRASDDMVKKIRFTWSAANGSPPITYDVYENGRLIGQNVQSGWVKHYEDDHTGNYHVVAKNNFGETPSNEDEGTCVAQKERYDENNYIQSYEGSCTYSLTTTCSIYNTAFWNGNIVAESEVDPNCMSNDSLWTTGDIIQGNDGTLYQVGEAREEITDPDCNGGWKYTIIKIS